MVTTDGKYAAHFKVLKTNAKIFGGAILQSGMQIYNATTAYKCYYLASTGFTTAATRFKNNQCQTSQRPVVCATLKKMSINRNVSRAIVFGPKHLGGMALIYLHTLQGLRSLKYFIGHIANNDGLGKLIHICIEATQLEVATFESFMFLLQSLHGHTTLTN
jgi:hypothetical protein